MAKMASIAAVMMIPHAGGHGDGAIDREKMNEGGLNFDSLSGFGAGHPEASTETTLRGFHSGGWWPI